MEKTKKTDRTETSSPARTKKKPNMNSSKTYSQKTMDRFVSPNPKSGSVDPDTSDDMSVEPGTQPDGWGEEVNIDDEEPEDTSPRKDNTNQLRSDEAPSPTPSDDEELQAAIASENPTDSSPRTNSRNVSFGSNKTREIPARAHTTKKSKQKSPKKGSKQKQSSTTVIRSQRSPDPTQRTLHTTRFQLVFNITRNENTDEGLYHMAEDLFREVLDVDPQATILPWWPDDTENPPLKGIDHLPGNTFKLRKYFDRLYLAKFQDKERSKGLWSAVYIQHSKPAEELRYNMVHWRHDFRIKDLQCPKTSVVGWGLYSTRNMDLRILQQYFLDKHQLIISCRWRAITLHPSMNLDNKDRPRAIHFEVDATTHAQAKRVLFQIYRKEILRAHDFPLGYRMRMVPEISQATSTQRPDVEKMILRQQHFAGMILSYSFPWGGHSIDQFSTTVGQTIRQLLITAVPPDDTTNPTFLSVKAERGSLMVDYLKPNERRAQEILRGIVPYAKYHIAEAHNIFDDDSEYDDLMGHVETLFPPALVSANADMQWSPTRDGVITIFDQYLQDITEDVDLFDFSEMEIQPRSSTEATLTPGEKRVFNVFQGRSADSVGTFSSKISTIPPSTSFLGVDGEEESESDDDSDEASLETMQSTIQSNLQAHLDRKLGTMQTTLLDAMQNMLKNGLPPTVQTSPSTESTTTLTMSQARNESETALPTPPGGANAGEDT